MVALAPEVWKPFVLAQLHTAKLATVRADGRTHIAPVWFDLDGDDLVFMTGAATVKGRNMARDPRVALCIDDEQPPFSYVSIEGSVETSDDIDLLRTWAARIGGRYMGAHRAEEYGARNGVPGELLVRVRVQRVTGTFRVADPA